jgi:hypothetical protein
MPLGCRGLIDQQTLCIVEPTTSYLHRPVSVYRLIQKVYSQSESLMDVKPAILRIILLIREPVREYSDYLRKV